MTVDPEGLEWGDLKVADLKRYGPFLIDESGKMIASGLSYKDLSSFIDEQVAINN